MTVEDWLALDLPFECVNPMNNQVERVVFVHFAGVGPDETEEEEAA